MTNIIPFIPKIELDAQANLDAFVAHYREMICSVIEGFNWDSKIWDITPIRQLKGRSRNTVSWNILGAPGLHPHNAKKLPQMEKPFVDFAKAFIVHILLIKNTVVQSEKRIALKILCRFLSTKNDPSIINIDEIILSDVQNYVLERYKNSKGNVQYSCLNQIKAIVNFAISKKITTAKFDWSPVACLKRAACTHIGPKYTKIRNENLPSPNALYALGEIFNNTKSMLDKLVTSTCGLMLSNPSRIGEVLSLHKRCGQEIERKDSKGKIVKRFGISWYPEKGGRPIFKDVLPVWSEVAKKSYDNIRSITSNARKVAKWYVENPARLYLPNKFEYLRGKERIWGNEIKELLYHDSHLYKDVPRKARKANGGAFITSLKMNCIGRRGHTRERGYYFSEFESKILSLLPDKVDSFVYDDLKYKYDDLLYVVPYNFFHMTRSKYSVPIGIIFEHVTYGKFSIQICNRLFLRYEKYEKRGVPVRITSHQFRRYLNTIAQAVHADQALIAAWSGRLKVEQNDDYNWADWKSETKSIVMHTKQLSRLKFSKDVTPKEKDKIFSSIIRNEFADRNLSVHIFDTHYCVHPAGFTPCDKYHDCFACNDTVFIKGQKEKKNRIIERYKVDKHNLNVYEKRMADGERHGGTWYEHQKRIVDHQCALIEVLTDDKLEDGAIIKPMYDDEYNPIIHIFNNRGDLLEIRGDTNNPELPEAM